MNHALKSKSFVKMIKLVSYLLLASAIIYILGIGNLIIRGLIVTSILVLVLLRFRKIWHAKASDDNEIGYWSGLDNFDIGLFDCFDDDDYEDFFENGTDEHIKTI